MPAPAARTSGYALRARGDHLPAAGRRIAPTDPPLSYGRIHPRRNQGLRLFQSLGYPDVDERDVTLKSDRQDLTRASLEEILLPRELRGHRIAAKNVWSQKVAARVN